MFSNNEIDYYHETRVNHTRKMVDNIRNRGIQVLSYFIGGDYGDERNLSDFRKMYGKDEMIDVTSVISVSKTMNKKFLEKVMFKWLLSKWYKHSPTFCNCG